MPAADRKKHPDLEYPMKALLHALGVVLLLMGVAEAQPVSSFPPASTPLSGGELLYIIQNGISKQITVGNFPPVSGSYTLPAATASVLGGVKPDGTTIANAAGAISVTYGTTAGTAAAGNDGRITGALSAATAASTYAPLVSPTFTGSPTAPTIAASAAAGTTRLATTAFVRNGTTTNDDALAGQVGQFMAATLGAGSAVSLSNNVPATVTSVSLTAGDWDCWGTVALAPAGSTTITSIAGGINTVAATLPTAPASGFTLLAAPFLTGQPQVLSLGSTRINLGSTTTVYLVTASAFGVSTMGGYGTLNCRRAR